MRVIPFKGRKSKEKSKKWRNIKWEKEMKNIMLKNLMKVTIISLKFKPKYVKLSNDRVRKRSHRLQLIFGESSWALRAVLILTHFLISGSDVTHKVIWPTGHWRIPSMASFGVMYWPPNERPK